VRYLTEGVTLQVLAKKEASEQRRSGKTPGDVKILW